MRKQTILIAILLLSITFISGCKSTKVYNVKQPIESFTPSHEQVGEAIKQAGSDLDWSVSRKGNAEYILNYYTKHYQATISVVYGPKEYDIYYVESQNLHFDNGYIHKTYNKLIKKLHKKIKQNLMEIKTANFYKQQNAQPVQQTQVSSADSFERLHNLHVKGLITDAEYKKKKDELLKEF